MHLLRRQTACVAILAVLLSSAIGFAGPGAQLPAGQDEPAAGYIVQARNADLAALVVARAGGTVTQRLWIIDGVAAVLDRAALNRLRADRWIRLVPDTAVRAAQTRGGAAAGSTPATVREAFTSGQLLYPSAATGAASLHQMTAPTRSTTCSANGVTISSAQQSRSLQGWGVTVAVIDSGLMEMQSKSSWQAAADGTLFAGNAEGRCIVYHDFLPRSAANANLYTKLSDYNSTDQNGHGTHVISTIADGRSTSLRQDRLGPLAPVGVAPKANLLIARALDATGAGTYGDVISAIQWVIANKTKYNVQVLNLSLYAPVTGPYWADPLGQATMQAWKAGLAVVVAAGNAGPNAGTITVPGNVPYVITVGAIKSGRYTQSGSDELAFYSSRGPTESAFVKPDLLVPGSRTIAPMPDGSTLATQLMQECARKAAAGIAQPCIETKADVDYGIGKPAKKHTYFYLSGTSMAAAEVSGLAALILQANPTLSNDQVKQRLMATAHLALESSGEPSYSPWEQGAGLADVMQATFSPQADRANVGMDINLDLTTDIHYWGNTIWDPATGQFQLLDPDSGQPIVWDGSQRIWGGSQRIWGGSQRIWGGSQRIWGGSQRIWGGGTSTWAASDSLWAGSQRIWAGATPVSSLGTASRTELMISDP